MKVFSILALLLWACQAQTPFDRLQTEELIQDPPGYYFFQVYVGSKLQKRNLLVDTQANGTAILYDYRNSRTAQLRKGLSGKIALPSSQNQGYIEGGVILDEIAFDSDEEIFVDDFMFLLADQIKYQELESRIDSGDFNGVIGFNRFGYEHEQSLRRGPYGIQGKSNVVKALIRDSMLTNYTFQLDLNPIVDASGNKQQSYISYEGVNMSNIHRGKVYYSGNLLKDSKWALNVQGATLGKRKLYEKCAGGQQCPGVIATASPSLKVPMSDFQNIVHYFIDADPQITLDDGQIKSHSACTSLNLAPLKLNFMENLELSIPPFLYTRALEADAKGYKCLILIEENKEDASWMDSISTEEDGYDYMTNNGYILGAPVLQSAMILLDFGQNKVGIAQKVHHFGARLRESGTPKDEQDQTDDTKDSDEWPLQPDFPEQTDSNGIPRTPNSKQQAGSNQNAKNQSYTGLYVFVFIMVIILAGMLAYVYYRKKQQRSHPTFMTVTDKVKQAEKQEYRENISKQRKERRNSMKKQREERRSKYEEQREQKKKEKEQLKQAKKDAEQQEKDEALTKTLLDKSIRSESIEPIDESDTEGGSFAEKQVTIK